MTLHVYSDGKRIPSLPSSMSIRQVDAIRDQLREASERGKDITMVLSDAIIVEHAYPLGDWKDMLVAEGGPPWVKPPTTTPVEKKYSV